MRKLLFIINPISGGISKHGLRKEIDVFFKNKINYSFLETKGENDKETIGLKIEEYKPTEVIACGGDGTVTLIAEILLNKPISLGIIPLGSANGLATELQIPQDIGESLQVILENNTSQIDVILINNKYYCLHLSDMGLNAKLIKRFSQGTQRGKVGYAKHFFDTLFNKTPKEYIFSFIEQEEKVEYKAEMVVFANAKKYGTGAIVNPEGKIADGKFEVCIFKPYPWYAIFRLTFLFFSGQLNYSPFVKIYSTKKVQVSCKTPEHLQIDGELMGKHRSVDVEIVPKALKMLIP